VPFPPTNLAGRRSRWIGKDITSDVRNVIAGYGKEGKNVHTALLKSER
jgi:hypothetical protein